MDNNKNLPLSKAQAVILCAIAYIAAIGVAYGIALEMNLFHPVIVAAAADIGATIVVFAFSLMMDNSSIYDPYWSVAPFPIALYFIYFGTITGAVPIRQVLVLILVAAWGIRLTWNWLRHWQGIDHEDWRYVDFRNKCGSGYWPVSFLGIHLFPTVMVFLGCLSLYPALTSGNNAFGIIDLIAVFVTAGAILIEGISDNQLMHFSKHKEPGQIMESGLWKYSRHPNYFGEITFWWGLFLFSLAADGFHWWTIIGPVAMTIMFISVSLPMMEKRNLERRPGYKERQKKVSLLIPWLPKNK